ncbi:hypothetical protein LF95_13375 [Thalassospira sp. TSL5-1]|nr:hypothetical protein LF95_13375 [Thalassospira sp. TSL5-1]
MQADQQAQGPFFLYHAVCQYQSVFCRCRAGSSSGVWVKKEQMGSNWYSAKSVIIWYGIAQRHFARFGMVKSSVYIPYLVWYRERWIATLLVVKTK